MKKANGYYVIDADGHLSDARGTEWLPLKFLDPAFKDRAPRRVRMSEREIVTFIDGTLYPRLAGPQVNVNTRHVVGLMKTDSPFDPHARIKDMDAEGMDVSVLFGGIIGLAGQAIEDTALAGALCHAYNDYVADYCKPYPRRLKGVASLPMLDPEGAVMEMERTVKELKFPAIDTPPSIRGRTLDNALFDPVYAAAERLDVPVCIHAAPGFPGVEAAGTDRFTNPMINHAMGHPFDQMQAVAAVVCGGVLDSHPKLRVAFLEAGAGWVPYWAERLDEHYEHLAHLVAAKAKPSEYMKGAQCFFSCEYDEQTLPTVVDLMGEDRIIYASDYYHWDCAYPKTISGLKGRKDISETAKHKILGENANRLYKLNGK